MAKSSKKKTNKSQADKVDTVEKTEVLEPAADESVTFDDPLPEDAAVDLNLEGDDQPDTPKEISDEIDNADFETEVADAPKPEDTILQSEEALEVASDINDVAAPVSDAPAAKSGVLPLVVGGIAAGAIGYAFALFGPEDETQDFARLISAQSDQISELEFRIAQIPAAPDLSGVEGQIAQVSGQITAQSVAITELNDQLTAIDERLLEVEKRPGVDGTLSDTALAAYQRELEQLRAEIDSQKEDVMSAAARAEADLTAARAEAEQLEQAAIEQAQAAAARAALNNIATAVETGASFEDALNSLSVDVPAVLVDASVEGVATNAELISGFPEAARAALATARSEGLTEDAGGLGGFLRSQLDIRSTTPQDGPGADAVLSRAEAAVDEGRIADALAEIQALPEVARAEMTDWTARAQQRSDVLDAISSLSETLN